MADGQHLAGQPGPDRAVGRSGPAARLTVDRTSTRTRPSVLISPVASPLAPNPSPASATTTPPPTAEGSAWDATPPAGREPVSAPSQPPGTAPAHSGGTTPQGGPRSARLFLTHIDPWSVMKQSFLLSLALAVVLLAAAAALWFALDSAGVLGAISRTATEVGGESGSSVSGFLELGRVMGVALVLAGIETVLITALSTLFAFMYNLSVGLGGGLEVTLSED